MDSEILQGLAGSDCQSMLLGSAILAEDLILLTGDGSDDVGYLICRITGTHEKVITIVAGMGQLGSKKHQRCHDNYRQNELTN